MQTCWALFEVCVEEHGPDLLTGLIAEMKVSYRSFRAVIF
jgi:hypothetical protein